MGFTGGKFVAATAQVMERTVGGSCKKTLKQAEFRGKRVGVDSGRFLHTAAVQLGNAEQLAGGDWPRFHSTAASVLRQMQELEACGPKLVVIFDGACPPGKANEKERRVAAAQTALDVVRTARRQGQEVPEAQLKAAASGMVNAGLISLTIDMLRRAGIEACRAPFEADSQLAHMNAAGEIDYVLSGDYDLVAYGCNVLFIPAHTKRTSSNPNPVKFRSADGGVVYHFHPETLCSRAAAVTELDALLTAKNVPKATEAAGLAQWLAAIWAKHGITATVRIGAISGVDHGSIKGAGVAAAVAAVYAAGLDIDEIGRQVAAKLQGTQYAGPIVVSAASERDSALQRQAQQQQRGQRRRRAAAPAAAAAPPPMTLEMAVAARIRQVVACFAEGLAFGRSAAGGPLQVVTLCGPLDRAAHAEQRRPELLGCTINMLVGEPPEDNLVVPIADGVVDPVTMEERDATGAWEDDVVLPNCVVTADLVSGARLQPAALGKGWDELTTSEKAGARVFGIADRDQWIQRFGRPWPKKLAELTQPQLAAAIKLGFNEPKGSQFEMWPPRPTRTVEDCKKFGKTVLGRYLVCRDIKPVPPKLPERAKLVESVLREEVAVLANDGAAAIRIRSPEGSSYLDLATARGSINLAEFAAATLKPPADETAWTTDFTKITTECCHISESLAFSEWSADRWTKSASSRNVKEGHARVAHIRDPRKLKLAWCRDATNPQREFLRFLCPKSMKSKDSSKHFGDLEAQQFECWLCVGTSTTEHEQWDVAVARTVLASGCGCITEGCVHVRALCIAAGPSLPRPAAVRVPVSSTYGKNVWKRQKKDAAHHKATPHKERPLSSSSLPKQLARQQKEKPKRRIGIAEPAAAMQLYDPNPPGFEPTPYDHSLKVAARRKVWEKAAAANGGQKSAHQVLYDNSTRQPQAPTSAADRREVDRLSQFWTLETEEVELRTAYSKARAQQQRQAGGATPAAAAAAGGGRAAAAGGGRAAAAGGGRAAAANPGGRGKQLRKPGGKRTLSTEDMLYMVVRVLRGGKTVQREGSDFGMKDASTSSRHFKPHVRALAEMLRAEHPRPEQAEIFESTPPAFSERAGVSDVELMVDGTNVRSPHPSDPEMARALWGEYCESSPCSPWPASSFSVPGSSEVDCGWMGACRQMRCTASCTR